jgi:isomerase DpgB
MTSELDLTAPADGLGPMVKLGGAQTLVELTGAVNAICDQVESRKEKSVMVLQLCGALPDGREWPGNVNISAVNRWERAVHRIECLAAASIAVAQGTCGGPALDLLLATDFRIGTPDVRLMLPINDGHFWPGMSIFRLVRQVGLARARQIVLWGTDIPLDLASELGLIDRVSDDIPEAVRTAKVLIGHISDRELTVRRQLLLEAGSVEYSDALGVHLAACDRELRRLGAVPPGPAERAGS